MNTQHRTSNVEHRRIVHLRCFNFKN